MTYNTNSSIEPSLSNLREIAECHNKCIIVSEHTFNSQAVYKIQGEKGLYTAVELKNRFEN